MKIFLIYTLSIFALVLGGCNKDKIPGVYRIDIQQGNAVDQQMINKLKPGMSKKQVAYIMGTPLLIDTFHPNRWDYIYSFHPGNGQREQRNLTLFFSDDAETLTHLSGNIRTVNREDLPQIDKESRNVEVPLSDQETGLFQGLLNSVGLGDDEIQEIAEDTTEEIGENTAEEAATELETDDKTEN